MRQLAIAGLAFGCLIASGSWYGLSGTGDVDRPDASREALSDYEFQAMVDSGVEIYGGSNPPDLSDVYVTESLAVTYDQRMDVGLLSQFFEYEGVNAEPPQVPCRWKFSSEGNLESAEKSTPWDVHRSCRWEDGEFGIWFGMRFQISGSDGCFTLYADQSAPRAVHGCSTSGARVISGCLTDEGIEDLQVADWHHIVGLRGKKCHGLESAKYLRVVEESDGLAAKKSE